MPAASSWTQIENVISDKLRLVVRLLGHRRKILAIAVLLVVVSFVFVAVYLGHREPQMDQDQTQWFLRSEEHTSELQSRLHLVCRLLLEKKKATSSYRISERTNQEGQVFLFRFF